MRKRMMDNFETRDEMVARIQTLIDGEEITVNSIRFTETSEIEESEYPSLIIKTTAIEMIQNASGWFEGDAIFTFMLIDILEDMTDDDEVDTKKRALKTDMKKIVNACIDDYGEITGNADMGLILDSGQFGVMVSSDIKK